MIKVFIPGNVPSLKNSKVKTSRGIFPSKTVSKYLAKQGVKSYSVSKKTVEDYKTRDNEFRKTSTPLKQVIEKDKPNVVYFHFVRDSKRRFDFHNAVQIIADLLVAHDIIEDDDMTCFIPMPKQKDGLWYSLDKDNPGVWIYV